MNDLPSLDRPEPTPPKIRALVMLEGEERLVLRPLENASPADRPVIASIALEQAIKVSPAGLAVICSNYPPKGLPTAITQSPTRGVVVANSTCW